MTDRMRTRMGEDAAPRLVSTLLADSATTGRIRALLLVTPAAGLAVFAPRLMGLPDSPVLWAVAGVGVVVLVAAVMWLAMWTLPPDPTPDRRAIAERRISRVAAPAVARRNTADGQVGRTRPSGPGGPHPPKSLRPALRPSHLPLHALPPTLHASRPGARSRCATGPDSSDLELRYEPQVDLRTGELVALEGLARWQRPDGVVVGPDQFLDGIRHSDHWNHWSVSAVRQAAELLSVPAIRRSGVRVSVNVSVDQLSDEDIVGAIVGLVRRHRIDPGRLVIEVTESDPSALGVQLVVLVGRLRAAGVELSIDDFGTGHSSFERLRAIGAEEVKIERTFTSQVGSSTTDDAMVSTVVWLARELGIRVVAEGVETDEQRDRLLRMGCTTGQGFLFSRALPVSEVVRLVASRRTWGAHHLPVGASA